jgi:uncharacterized protein (DUF2147 family)
MDHNGTTGWAQIPVNQTGNDCMKRIFLMAILAGLAVEGAKASQAGGSPEGLWRMDSGKVTIEVSPCGPNYCGKIVDLAKPLNRNGKPKRDRENPDRSLRKRPIIGLTIISDMRPVGENRWKGTIYNADDGQTYDSKMKLQSEDVMIVEGCVLMFCKDMTFERVIEQ